VKELDHWTQLLAPNIVVVTQIIESTKININLAASGGGASNAL
jgi:hypothetical protein